MKSGSYKSRYNKIETLCANELCCLNNNVSTLLNLYSNTIM